jgi:hypothetical protein
MESDVSKLKLKSRSEFIEFKDFKTSVEGSSKRIKISSIEEYYICSKGRLTIFHSGRKSMFEYKDQVMTEKLLDRIDSLFNIKLV